MKNKEQLIRIFKWIAIVFAIVFIYNEFFGISIIRKVAYPIMNVFSDVTNKTTGFIDEKYIHNEKDQKIKTLEQENEKLRKQLSDNIFSAKELKELNELKRVLNYHEEQIFEKYVSADIIAKDSNGFYTNFVISAGLAEGIKKGDLVLSGNGVVGVVENAQQEYSRVISIMDSSISLSFGAVRNEKINGIASQNISSEKFKSIDEGLLRGYVFEDAPILVGDILVTSGMGEYPKGIEIGEVFEVFEDDESLLKYITIKPYTNFTNLTKVMVVNSREIQ